MLKQAHKILYIVLFCVTISSFSQTGPGGVGSTDGLSKLGLWLDASVGVEDASSMTVLDGADMTFWRDQSGNGFDAQQLTAADKPNYSASGLGGQPTINFTISNTEYISASYAFQEDLHAFVVGSSIGTNWSSYGLLGSARSANGLIFHTSNGNKRTQYYSLSTSGAFIYLGQVEPPNITVPNIYDFSIDHNAGSVAYDVGYNGSSATGSVSQTRASSTETVLFGRDDCCGSRFMNGTIGEVIYFNEKLNIAEEIIVNNYLSAKYGVSLSSNDFYDEDTSGENFDFNVAGIGRASDGSLHLDSQGTGIIRINTPSDLNNDEFLFWGEDVKDANYDFSSSLSTDYIERLDTKWRVSKRNDLGTVMVTVAAADITLNVATGCNDLKLIVSSSSTFATKTTYDLVLSSGIYTATGVSFTDNDYFTIEYIDSIVIDATTAYNGTGGSNKPNRLDDCYKLLVKTNSLTLTEDADVREIEVEAGSILAVNSGIRLQVTNGINNSGDIRLVGSSQLVQTHSSTSNLNTGSGNLHVDQTASTSTEFQSGYWSSPVSATVGAAYSINDVLKDGSVPTAATSTAGEAVDIDFISGFDGSSASSPIEISTRWLATFNNASDWTRFVSPTATVLTPALGWNMKSVGSTFTFKGKPNDGEYSFSIGLDNYSLLGNPYPSALDSDAFITQNAGEFNGELYIYDSSSDNTHVRGDYTGTYSTIVSGLGVGAVGRYLPIGQAFFVTREVAGTGSLTFRNSQRTLEVLTNTSSITARSETAKKETGLPILRIGFEFDLSETEKRSRQVAVAFRGLTNNYDRGLDAEMWGLQPTDLYLKVNDREAPYIITGIEDFETSLNIPLVVQLDEQRNVTFRVDEIKNIASSVYLFDSLENIFYDITENPQVLNLSSGQYSDRFFITFSTEVLSTDDIVNTFIKIFQQNNKELVIKNTGALFIESITMYDLLGKKVLSYKVNAKKETINIDISKLATSFYIVTLETDKSRISKKIVLE